VVVVTPVLPMLVVPVALVVVVLVLLDLLAHHFQQEHLELQTQVEAVAVLVVQE